MTPTTTAPGIEEWEPRFAPRPLAVWGTSGSVAETAAMHLQLVRALQAGVDVDGDGTTDLDASQILLHGPVARGRVGRDGVRVCAGNPRGGVRRRGWHARLPAPALAADRPMFAADLAARTPSLLNSAYGLRTIDGVAVAPPFFNESLPLRDQRPLTDPAPGATAIQRVLDRKAWGEQTASAVAFAPLLRRAPPAGVPARPFVFQFARSDLATVNPASSETVRAGDFADRVTYYRHDLNFGLAGVPAGPHNYITAQQQPANYARVAIGGAEPDRDAVRERRPKVIHPDTHGTLGGPDQVAVARGSVLLASASLRGRNRRLSCARTSVFGTARRRKPAPGRLCAGVVGPMSRVASPRTRLTSAPTVAESRNCPNDEADRVVSDGTFSGEDVMPIREIGRDAPRGRHRHRAGDHQRRMGRQGDDRDDGLGDQV